LDSLAQCIASVFVGVQKTLLQKPATRRLAGGLIVVLAGISLVWLGFNLSGTGQHDHTQTQHAR